MAAIPSLAHHKIVPSTQTRWIDLNLILMPEDARPHSPEYLASLIEDMRIHGQLQEIVVVPRAGMFEVRAGIGRVQAARKLGWEKIRALVKEGASEFEMLHITFSENEEREDASLLYQAKLLKRMMELGNMNQQMLADKIGKATSVVSDYLSVLKLHPEVQEKFAAANLTLRQIREVRKVEDRDLQMKLVEECVLDGLSGKGLYEKVQQLLSKREGAANKISEHHKTSASPKKNLPYTLYWKGQQVMIKWRIMPGERNLDEFLDELKKEINQFYAAHRNPSSQSVSSFEEEFQNVAEQALKSRESVLKPSANS